MKILLKANTFKSKINFLNNITRNFNLMENRFHHIFKFSEQLFKYQTSPLYESALGNFLNKKYLRTKELLEDLSGIIQSENSYEQIAFYLKYLNINKEMKHFDSNKKLIIKIYELIETIPKNTEFYNNCIIDITTYLLVNHPFIAIENIEAILYDLNFNPDFAEYLKLSVFLLVGDYSKGLESYTIKQTFISNVVTNQNLDYINNPELLKGITFNNYATGIYWELYELFKLDNSDGKYNSIISKTIVKMFDFYVDAILLSELSVVLDIDEKSILIDVYNSSFVEITDNINNNVIKSKVSRLFQKNVGLPDFSNFEINDIENQVNDNEENFNNDKQKTFVDKLKEISNFDYNEMLSKSKSFYLYFKKHILQYLLIDVIKDNKCSTNYIKLLKHLKIPLIRSTYSKRIMFNFSYVLYKQGSYQAALQILSLANIGVSEDLFYFKNLSLITLLNFKLFKDEQMSNELFNRLISIISNKDNSYDVVFIYKCYYDYLCEVKTANLDNNISVKEKKAEIENIIFNKEKDLDQFFFENYSYRKSMLILE